MIPKECKRLAEIDFPVAGVSKYSAKEKYVRNTPNTALHTWWAQRPLAACRAMIMALLLPDPCDNYCPEDFKAKSRDLLSSIMGKLGSDDKILRNSLLNFISEFSNWDKSGQPIYLEVSRALLKASHGKDGPFLVDPFAGSGSIPFEALRLGCHAFASDLNPVSTLILKTILNEERKDPELISNLRSAGEKLKAIVEPQVAEFYPIDADGAQPAAFFWAKTVRCESPKCSAEIPLIRSFWLCKKRGKRRALKYKILNFQNSNNNTPAILFEVFEPKNDSEVPKGNITRAKATCLCCKTVLSPERVRAQLRIQKGGIDVIFDSEGRRTGGAILIAVMTVIPGSIIRNYRKARQEDYEPIKKAISISQKLATETASFKLPWIPNEPIERVPVSFGVINVWFYGMTQWGDLFSSRQRAAIALLFKNLRNLNGISPTVRKLLAFTISKFARHCNGNARWNNVVESVEPAFGTPSLPFTWTFPESSIWGPWAENFDGSLKSILNCLEKGFIGISKSADVEMADATKSPLPDESVDLWFTDPPYYDNVPYAYLSDFFYVWLRRALGDQFPNEFQTKLTPKKNELVAYLGEDGNSTVARNRFEEGLAKAAKEGRRILKNNGIGCVVFAHKTTEGWEALLSGMINAGMTITGSWPISTERSGRLRARESAALSSSVHLICRPRPENARTGDWEEVLRELPKRARDWIERLQMEGIRGADLVFSCIGPALEVFSRYSKVETAEGREVKLGEYLEKVWEIVGRTALEQVLGTTEAKARNGMAGAIEEDARLTALFLWTMQATNGQNGGISTEEEDESEKEEDEEESPPREKTKGYSLIFDVVRRFAQPLGIELPKWEGRIIETRKGIVRLMAISERAKQLFGDSGANTVADCIVQDPKKNLQQFLFPEMEEERVPKVRGRVGRRKVVTDPSSMELQGKPEATTLDRLHAAMLLQAGGQANALRQLIKSEQERGPDFLRLANALSALYPKESEEKRLLDAMLLAVPR